MVGRGVTGFRGRCALSLVAGLLAATVLAGCSKHGSPPIKGTKLAVFPVKGKLMMDGKAMSSATIIFNPVRKPPKEASQMMPHATVDQNGDFTVSTYGTGDGARRAITRSPFRGGAQKPPAFLTAHGPNSMRWLPRSFKGPAPRKSG